MVDEQQVTVMQGTSLWRIDGAEVDRWRAATPALAAAAAGVQQQGVREEECPGPGSIWEATQAMKPRSDLDHLHMTPSTSLLSAQVDPQHL